MSTKVTFSDTNCSSTSFDNVRDVWMDDDGRYNVEYEPADASATVETTLPIGRRPVKIEVNDE